jgi:hypothetical protein
VVAARPHRPVAAPGVTFEEGESARSIHEKLVELARVGAAWDDVVGLCAHAVREGGLHRRHGFASFRNYCEERLGLAASTVEARAALQKRLAASPALQEAKRQKLPYEKLRLLSRLPEPELGGWGARAKKLTVIALRRRLEGEQAARMRAAGKESARVPVQVACSSRRPWRASAPAPGRGCRWGCASRCSPATSRPPGRGPFRGGRPRRSSASATAALAPCPAAATARPTRITSCSAARAATTAPRTRSRRARSTTCAASTAGS